MFDEKKTASFVLHIYMGVKGCSWTNKNEKKINFFFKKNWSVLTVVITDWLMWTF